MKYPIPRGTYDILPDQSYKWQYLIRRFQDIAASFGYHEINTPIFEVSALFERSSGESSDVVQKEMYRFTDRRGREFALRPEGTAPVVRSFVENSMDKDGAKTKLFYVGPMFRYDRPQAGRYRQFWQYGIEFFGAQHPFYDAEVIALLWQYLKGLGLSKIELRINSVGSPQCWEAYEKVLKEYYRPHLPQLCADCQTRFEIKPKRLLDCKVPSCRTIAQDAPSQLDHLDEESRQHFAEVQGHLNAAGVPYIIDPHIVRGLDYYSHTAFEVVFDGLGAQNTLAGGGRYNYLVEQIGGKSTPAIGFAGGFERLILALESEGIQIGKPLIPDIYAIAMGAEAQEALIPLIYDLRRELVSVEYDPTKTSFKAQMKAANHSQARFALIIGEDELASGSVILKDLETGEQVSLSSKDIDAIRGAVISK
ncbi:MAG: histidine--tRNA ligase [Candidatus Cloacimonetes bacterium]|nr:histidine--tRNA ligase [Candidatus Cloacimonadota bacterium]NLO11744.1 histidine--tRNA ligase [Candidatus Cloacimonadota bacterium]